MTTREEARRLADAIDDCFADDLLQQATKLLRQWPEAGEHVADPFAYIIQHLNSSVYNMTKDECIHFIKELRERYAAPGAAQPEEMSPEFTDTARNALLWVLWHHQGYSSKIGQAMRFALGMGEHDHLTDRQIADAKRWSGPIPGLAHLPAAQPSRPDEFVCPRCFDEGAAPQPAPSGMVPTQPEPKPIGKVLSEAEMGTGYDRRMGDVIWWSKPIGPAMIYAAAAPQAAPKPLPLTDAEIEQLRERTFSTNNPYCPVDSKSMRKAVRAAERAHGIGITAKEKP